MNIDDLIEKMFPKNFEKINSELNKVFSKREQDDKQVLKECLMRIGAIHMQQGRKLISINMSYEKDGVSNNLESVYFTELEKDDPFVIEMKEILFDNNTDICKRIDDLIDEAKTARTLH